MVLPLWVVENRPSPITLAIGLYNSLYYRTTVIPQIGRTVDKTESSTIIIIIIIIIIMMMMMMMIIIPTTMFIVLSSCQRHSERSPGSVSFDESRTSSGDLRM